MSTESPYFEIRRLTPAIGAEITGLDLSIVLTPETLANLRQVWLERKVLFFRDQKLTPDQQLAFSRQFGELEKYPFLPGIPGHPLIATVLKQAHETVNFGGLWHSDTSYLETPAMGATLYALEIPPLGGDTLFANMALAYETLSEPLKARIRDLHVVNSSAKAEVTKTREDRIRDAGDEAVRQEFVSRHPLVRGRIRYPGLYFLFHTLESIGWLHELTDEELLDVCDDAGLDRWQNRIEDVNYLTKRRLEYLRWQKTGGVSMH